MKAKLVEEIKRIGGVTKDTFYRGNVQILQPIHGYRFSLDAPILADFLPDKPDQEALEVGTGSGIISLLALYKDKFKRVFGVEVQRRLSRLAKINAKINEVDDRLDIQNSNFKKTFRNFIGIPIIFSNPPFMKVGQGRLSPNPEIRKAKFETGITLSEIVEISAGILGNPGSILLILPFERKDESIALAERNGLSVARYREVFSFSYGKPERILIELSNNSDSTLRSEPLIIFKEKGIYSEEMETIFSGRK